MDNYYTSVALFEELEERKTLACGAVRSNRSGLQKSTNLNWLVDPSSRVVTAILNEYPHLWIHCSSLQKQKSFIKDTTDFISFIDKTKIGKDTILVSMDVSSLYTNIPQEEGTEIVCKAYDSFHNYNPPIPTRFLREMLGLILNENSFQFNGENYLQTHGTTMGTKMAVSFANIFMAKIETTLIQQSETKPKEWRRYIDDIFSLWDSHEKDVDQFIEQANKFRPTIKFITCDQASLLFLSGRERNA